MKKTDKTVRAKNEKIEPIRITDEMLIDNEMDEFLRQSLIEEADRLEEELNSDPELMGVGASDDLFLKIKARLREMGAWEEDGPEGAEFARSEKIRKEEDGSERVGGREESGVEKSGREEFQVEKEGREGSGTEKKRSGEGEESIEVRAGKIEEIKAVEGRDFQVVKSEEEKRNGDQNKDGENAENVERTKNIRDAEKTENIKNTKSAGDIKSIGNTEDTNKTKKTAKQGAEDTEDIYKFLSEEDRKALELGRKVQIRKKKNRKHWRQAAAAVATVTVVLAVGLRGGASKNWILNALDRIMTMAGNRLQINYHDEQENIRLNEEKEREAWEKIKEELDIPVIEFFYRPEDMTFDKINISEKMNEVSLYYWYRETILQVYIRYGKRNASAYFISEDEDFLQDVVTNNQKISVKIWNTTTGSTESYMASFEYQDVMYFISGRLPLEEMEEMVNLMYLY